MPFITCRLLLFVFFSQGFNFLYLFVFFFVLSYKTSCDLSSWFVLKITPVTPTWLEEWVEKNVIKHYLTSFNFQVNVFFLPHLPKTLVLVLVSSIYSLHTSALWEQYYREKTHANCPLLKVHVSILCRAENGRHYYEYLDVKTHRKVIEFI